MGSKGRRKPTQFSYQCAVQWKGCGERKVPRRSQESDASRGSVASPTDSSRAVREARALVLGKGIREVHQAAPRVTIPILEGSSTSQDPSLGRRPLREEHDALREW